MLYDLLTVGFADQSTIDRWRSDTLSMLVAKPSFGRDREKAIEDILVAAEKAISPWLLNREAFTQNKVQFRQEIIRPAVEIHQAMRISVERYNIFRSKAQPETNSDKTHLESATLRDIGTWRTVNADNVEGVLSCLYPGINRLDAADKSVELVQPVLVVTVASPAMRMQLTRSRTGDSREAHSKPAKSKESDTRPCQFETDQPRQKGRMNTASSGREPKAERNGLFSRLVEWVSRKTYHSRSSSPRISLSCVENSKGQTRSEAVTKK